MALRLLWHSKALGPVLRTTRAEQSRKQPRTNPEDFYGFPESSILAALSLRAETETQTNVQNGESHHYQGITTLGEHFGIS